MSKYTTVIWDFNGTILDDVKVCIDSVNVLLKKRNIPLIDNIEKYYSVFQFPIINYYKALGFDLVKEDFSDVAVEWVNQYNAMVGNAKMYPDIENALELFSEKGFRQVILSATEINMLRGQIEDLGISCYFDEILGIDNIEAHGKEDIALNWIKRQKGLNAIMIGDTTHDGKVAELMGVDCCLVAGGHQSKKTISEAGYLTFDSINDVVCHIIA